MAEEPKKKPDLTGARVFEEADGQNVAGGKWHALPDRVVFARDTGSFGDPALITLETLVSNPRYREITKVEGSGGEQRPDVAV